MENEGVRRVALLSGEAPSQDVLKTITQKFSGHIRLMRPFAWLWFDTLPAISLLFLFGPTNFDYLQAATVVLILVLVDSASTTLNDIFDIETDRASIEASRNQRPLVTGLISRSAAFNQVFILFLLAAVLSWSMGYWMFLAACFAMTLGISYSVPPFRFSANPKLSNLFWFACGTSFYLVIAAASGKLYTPSSLLWLVGYFGFYATGENLAKDLRDWKNDSISNKETRVVRIGTKKAATLSYWGGALGLSAYGVMTWTLPQANLFFQVCISLLLVGWLFKMRPLVSQIKLKYNNGDARLLHLGYIITYLLFNFLLILNFIFQ